MVVIQAVLKVKTEVEMTEIVKISGTFPFRKFEAMMKLLDLIVDIVCNSYKQSIDVLKGEQMKNFEEMGVCNLITVTTTGTSHDVLPIRIPMQ